jgi:alpha-methylacyl-CoA racemase
VGAIEPQFYALLREKIGATDAAFDVQNDATAWPALKEKTAALFGLKTRDEWCALLEGSDACFAPVLDWDEAIHHPHNRARDTFIEIDGVTQPAPAPRFSRTPPAPPTAVAAAGEHSDAILRDWGIDEATITTLRADGVI